MLRKVQIREGKEWSGRKDLNLRPPGPEPGALARLRYAPTILNAAPSLPQGFLEYHKHCARARRVFCPAVYPQMEIEALQKRPPPPGLTAFSGLLQASRSCTAALTPSLAGA